MDGRSADLTEQAKVPFLNPVEMNMPNEASVIKRVQENENYVKTFKEIYGKGSDFVDNGLYDNPHVKDTSLKGAFRVSTLRNIAVTGPYMHNGVFKDLATVVHFYNTRDTPGAINPETGEAWEKGEVDEHKNTDELANLKLTKEEADLVAFLLTLTDEQYEHLIP